jgi:phosphoenolpyruvate phosphomutase
LQEAQMKALILNSGIGKRMRYLTNDKPKCLVEVNDNETLLSRQLRMLENNDIIDIVMTTGPYQNMLIKYVKANHPNLNVEYVFNPSFDSTNYIYSIYLAKDKLNDSILLIHGDMVFDEKVLKDLLRNSENNLVLVNRDAEIPAKDFKGRINNEIVVEIGVNLFGKDCYMLMPVYKLSKSKFAIWLNEIKNFIANQEVSVYAENAFNNVSDKIELKPFYYSNILCMEVDTPEDLEIAKQNLS